MTGGRVCGSAGPLRSDPLALPPSTPEPFPKPAMAQDRDSPRIGWEEEGEPLGEVLVQSEGAGGEGVDDVVDLGARSLVVVWTGGGRKRKGVETGSGPG